MGAWVRRVLVGLVGGVMSGVVFGLAYRLCWLLQASRP